MSLVGWTYGQRIDAATGCTANYGAANYSDGTNTRLRLTAGLDREPSASRQGRRFEASSESDPAFRGRSLIWCDLSLDGGRTNGPAQTITSLDSAQVLGAAQRLGGIHGAGLEHL